MSTLRLSEGSDATWARAWVVTTTAERTALLATHGSPLGPKRGDMILDNETGQLYLVTNSGGFAQITGNATVPIDLATEVTGELDDSHLSANVALLDAVNVFTENQRVSKSNPKWLLNDPGASANNRLISFDGTAGDFSFEFLNDDGTLQTLIFSVQRSTGNAQFAVDLEVLGLIGAVGGTVLFPATQVPNPGANALDDYEESDSFTSDLSFGGASTGITYTFNTFSYTKIGRQVCVCGLIVLSSKGSATGVASFTLPFPVTSGNQFASANGMNFANMAVTVNNAIASCINGTSGASIFQTAAGTTVQLTDAEFTNTSVLVLQVNYFTDT